MRAYEQFQVDALNMTPRDLPFFARVMTPAFAAANPTDAAFFKRVISANITTASTDRIAPQRFIVREIADRNANAKSKSFKVAFVGFSEAAGDLPAGFSIADPVTTARAVVPEARRSADFVIALAYVTPETATRLAREVQGIDAIIVCHPMANETLFTAPMQFGQTQVLFASFETRMLGELYIYRDAQGKFSTKARFISIDPLVPDDAIAAQTAAAATNAESEKRQGLKTVLENWLAQTRLRRRPETNATSEATLQYVTAGACAQCHTEQYIKWSATKHAHTTDPLVAKSYEFDADCLACHASGWDQTKAFNIADLPKLQQVQCEQCHGAGSEHAAKPAKGYGRVSNWQAVCTACHTAKISPNFNARTAWEKIKH